MVVPYTPGGYTDLMARTSSGLTSRIQAPRGGIVLATVIAAPALSRGSNPGQHVPAPGLFRRLRLVAMTETLFLDSNVLVMF